VSVKLARSSDAPCPLHSHWHSTSSSVHTYHFCLALSLVHISGVSRPPAPPMLLSHFPLPPNPSRTEFARCTRPTLKLLRIIQNFKAASVHLRFCSHAVTWHTYFPGKLHAQGPAFTSSSRSRSSLNTDPYICSPTSVHATWPRVSTIEYMRAFLVTKVFAFMIMRWNATQYLKLS
jgi:hypothetical protein